VACAHARRTWPSAIPANKVGGGTSPFGLRKPLPIYMEASIAGLDRVYLNGGKRGYLTGLATAEVTRLLQPTLVSAVQSSREA
jgi:prolyl-tRNA editing enzyme YbaK/EbsC (Cys-tRNA(Pro) deacylase)